MGTTTIEVTDDQKERLEAHKRADREAMKTVVGRVLDAYEGEDGDEIPEGLRVLADADDETLADIRDQLATVEERTGRLERLLEDLQ
jgi:hypothetical protein